METKVFKINPDNIDGTAIVQLRECADIIKRGGLVCMPTETVYGLGANAYDPVAVSNIFKAKGRPSDNPLIVHICNYDIEGTKHFVIGGAYSVDKKYRIARGYGWWENEQPSDEIKAYVESQIDKHSFDVILSHTCPLKYEPIEMFLSMIDQSTVDKSTEVWLDSIEERVKYKAWFCGHWHTNKRIDKMHFLYGDFEFSSMLKAQEIIDEKN